MTVSFKNYSAILKRNLIFVLLLCKEGPLILSGFPRGISSKESANLLILSLTIKTHKNTHFFKFYFIFKLYKIVLVLPNI